MLIVPPNVNWCNSMSVQRNIRMNRNWVFRIQQTQLKTKEVAVTTHIQHNAACSISWRNEDCSNLFIVWIQRICYYGLRLHFRLVALHGIRNAIRLFIYTIHNAYLWNALFCCCDPGLWEYKTCSTLPEIVILPAYLIRCNLCAFGSRNGHILCGDNN